MGNARSSVHQAPGRLQSLRQNRHQIDRTKVVLGSLNQAERSPQFSSGNRNSTRQYAGRKVLSLRFGVPPYTQWSDIPHWPKLANQCLCQQVVARDTHRKKTGKRHLMFESFVTPAKDFYIRTYRWNVVREIRSISQMSSISRLLSAWSFLASTTLGTSAVSLGRPPLRPRVSGSNQGDRSPKVGHDSHEK